MTAEHLAGRDHVVSAQSDVAGGPGVTQGAHGQIGLQSGKSEDYCGGCKLWNGDRRGEEMKGWALEVDLPKLMEVD